MLFLLFTPVFSLQAQPPTINNSQPQRILFLNQVRGEECCDAGSFDHLQRQISTFNNHNLPANFAIRYDALTDKKYVEVLKNISTSKIQLGVLLEVTPSLAQKSEVEYHGSNEDWYEAQHVFTLGYSTTDRRKLIDTVMHQFNTVFGYYPTFTTAWVMDTDSINYLREQYGVAVHQITREQWGTDSYTLSGGPIHYPYFASKSWAFLPANNVHDQQPINSNQQHSLILRQTVSDPLWNYGDSTNAFTTQPNDYAIDGKDFGYFEKLLTQMLHQTANSYSFALLGLENSMDQRYQEEFIQQIAYVAQLQQNNPSQIKILTADDFYQEYQQSWSREEVSVVEGSDLVEDSNTRTFWITTPSYRVRFLRHNQKLLITDLRIYNQQLVDPYNHYQARNLAYWVTPFIFDGSRFYSDVSAPTSVIARLKDRLRQHLLPEYIHNNRLFQPTKHDSLTSPIGLHVLDLTSENYVWEHNENNHPTLRFLSEQNEPLHTFSFYPTHFTVESQSIENSIAVQQFEQILPLTIQKENGTMTIQWKSETPTFHLRIACAQSHLCTFTPEFDDSFDQQHFQQQYYPFIFPEIVDRPIDDSNTILYAHNPYAVAGLNPVRFVLTPKDVNGYPVSTHLQPHITAQPTVEDFIIQAQEGNTGVTFIDMIENRVGKYDVSVQLGDEVQKVETVYFAPNCKETLTYCMKHPHQAWWYIKSLMMTKLRETND